MTRKSFLNITKLFLVKGGSAMLAVILVAVGLLFLNPLPANAATCNISASPTTLSLTSGDYTTITFSGGVTGYSPIGHLPPTTSNTITLSTSDGSVVAVVSPPPDLVDGYSAGMSATYTVNARRAGSATLTATYTFSAGGTSCSKSVGVTVSISSYSQSPTDLQSSYSAGRLEIVRGTVDSSGNITAGSGFTSIKNWSTGAIHISYPHPFSETPTLIVSANGYNPRLISPSSESQYGADFYAWTNKGYQRTDTGFNFVAIGKTNGTGCPFWKTPEETSALQVVRGHLGWNGSGSSHFYAVLDGKGFYVDRTAAGSYKVTFLKPFSATPTVIVASEDSGQFSILSTPLISSSFFMISAYKADDSAPSADANIEFIAVGPSTSDTGCHIFGIEPTPLQVANGRMAANGSANGSNYGVAAMWHNGGSNSGDYSISYSAPFTGNPAALSTNDSWGADFAAVRNGNSSQTEVLTWTRATGDGDVYSKDRATSFVAIGPVAALPPPLTGTIRVNSVNSKTGALVSGSWYFPGYPSTDPCSLSSCGQTSSTSYGAYNNMPQGPYTLFAPYSGKSNPPGFAFGGVHAEPQFAFQENKSLGFWGDWLTKVAKAFTILGCGTSGPPDAPLTCSITGSNGTIIFDIKWDPEAQISIVSPVPPNPLNLTVTAGQSANGTIALKNTGTDGSELNWTVSSVSYGPEASGWLSSPSSGGPISSGATQNVTVTADAGSLSAGSYSATAIFAGTSANIAGNPPTSPRTQPVTVNLQVVAQQPQPVSCNSFTASPTTIIPPQPTTLSWDCTGLSGCSITSDVGPDIGPVAAVGSTNISPASSTVYTLACTNTAGGGVITPLPLQVDVTVNAPGTIEIPP